MLYFVDRITSGAVLCSDEGGRKEWFARALLPADIELDMAVIRKRDGSFRPYEGSFMDEDGLWWQIVCDGEGMRLENRRKPLTNAEITEFLRLIADTNDRKLLPQLNMLISDLLQDGRAEFAQMLMLRAESLGRA